MGGTDSITLRCTQSNIVLSISSGFDEHEPAGRRTPKVDVDHIAEDGQASCSEGDSVGEERSANKESATQDTSHKKLALSCEHCGKGFSMRNGGMLKHLASCHKKHDDQAQ